jgi:hypothetical protein
VYAVLYTATRLDTIAQETQVLSVDNANQWTLDTSREKQYSVARYHFEHGGIFIPIEDRNARVFGLHEIQSFGDYTPYQEIGYELFQRYGSFAHGLMWRSFHRHQQGPVYAIWHPAKERLRLVVDSVSELVTDPDWQEMLGRIPSLVRIA